MYSLSWLKPGQFDIIFLGYEWDTRIRSFKITYFTLHNVVNVKTTALNNPTPVEETTIYLRKHGG